MITFLLSVDGSKHALVATRKLIAHASWLKHPLSVELVTVQGYVPVVKGMSRAVIKQADVERHFRNEAEKALAPSKRLLQKARIHYTAHILTGEVAPSLVKHAHDNNCQLIYMGTRGLTALSGLVLGSVAVRVLHLAKVPVVLVK
ncbi:MAG TPA: universal stress protein [Burkholderiales bacterium]|nr:universal stress protein [Burkholderiales bacterium]